MAVKHLLGRPGIGFSPGKVQYLLTRGLEIGEAPEVVIPTQHKASLSDTVLYHLTLSDTVLHKLSLEDEN